MTSTTEDAQPLGPARMVLTAFLPFAFGYLLSYLFRTVNAVIADDLTRSVPMEAAGLGLLTSAYFVTFAAIQLPLGIMLDRFGPRRVEAALLAVAALGALVFSFGESIAALAVGRAIIGLGVSACLMAAFKNTVLWWPKHRLPLVNGMILSFGGLGILIGTTPMAALLTVMDWRAIFRLLAAITLACAAYIYLAVPERRAAYAAGETLASQIQGTWRILTSGFFWRVAPVSVVVQASFLAYVGLWTAPFLRDVDGLARDAVAEHLRLMAIAMILGNVGLGSLTERLDRRGIRPMTVAAVLMAVFMANQALLLLPGAAPPALSWSLFSFFGTASLLGYAILSQHFPPELAGRVNTALNLVTFIAAFAAQWAIGAVIALYPAAPGGYDPAGHRLAFAAMLVLGILSLVWFLLGLRRR